VIANPDYAFVPLFVAAISVLIPPVWFVAMFHPPGSGHSMTNHDTQNTTRRYLCEALSFQYRYVPIGLLEYLPGKINDRPPAYRGRDELGQYFLILVGS